MALQYIIAGAIIPAEDVTSQPATNEKLSKANKDLIADKLDIVLTNIDPTKYDDRYSTSLFYGVDFYDKPVFIYDDEQKVYVWKGKIKNIDVSDTTVTIETYNLIADLQKICTYDNTARTETVAEAIYNILTYSEQAGVSEDDISYKSYLIAKGIQTAAACYVQVTYAAADNKKCIDVINELREMCQLDMYTRDNIIYFSQWQAFDGAIGETIKNKHLVPGKYSHNYDYELISDYSIKYLNSTVVGTVTGESSVTSGKTSFVIPTDGNDETDPSEYKVLFITAAGATWAGELAISRSEYMKKYAKIDLVDDMRYLKCGDQLDLCFTPFNREPARIIERKRNDKKGIISLVCEFLNTPHQYYSRDEEAPAPVELVSAIPLDDGGVCLKWTKSTETDHIGYKVYFTSTLGEWESEICHLGQSPIDRKITAVTEDGYIYTNLYQLNPGTIYYFRVSSYDSSYNESDLSNIISCAPIEAGQETTFRISGDLITGITIDASGAGTPLSGWDLYGSGDYGDYTYTPAGYYTSPVFYKSTGFTILRFFGHGDYGDIKYQYRISIGGEWSDLENAIGSHSVVLDSCYVQFRMIFYSSAWTDEDYFVVREVA